MGKISNALHLTNSKLKQRSNKNLTMISLRRFDPLMMMDELVPLIQLESEYLQRLPCME